MKKLRNEANIFLVNNNVDLLPLPGDEDIEEIPSLPEELLSFSDVLSDHAPGNRPLHPDALHHIELEPGTKPPYGPLYPLSPKELTALREYIEENLRLGRIRHSTSSAASPILFVPKKDGGLRLCVDYRGLNKIIIKNRYPLPLISEILDRTQGSYYFSKIDIKDAYYRIRIAEGDEWKTAFRTRYGLFEYTVMPFGLTNAPATFQHYISLALSDLLDACCIVYLDDILIFSKDRDNHTKDLHQILERLRGAGLYAKPSKCAFYQKEVEFLGYILSPDGVSMDPKRVRTVEEWPKPQSYYDIQVFLGFCNFYRRFIQGYAKLSRPLSDLLRGSKDGRKPGAVTLEGNTLKAFHQLKGSFTEAPVLRHFDPKKRVRIETDASKFAIAAVLSQQHEDRRWYPVAFWSRKLNPAEVNYGTPDQEMLAIVEAFKHWRQYVEGQESQVEVLTDHQNLQSFMKQSKLNGRQARWLIFLAPYDFVIAYRTGKTNPADAPSRRPDYKGQEESNTELLPLLQAKMPGATPDETSRQGKAGEMPVTASVSVVAKKRAKETMIEEDAPAQGTSEGLLRQVRYLQKNDQECRRVRANPKLGERGFQEWSVKHDLLLWKNRVYLPGDASVRREILELYHDDPLAGHFGRTKTKELIQRKFHWTKMQEDIEDYIRGCSVCQGTTTKRHRPYGELQPLPQPSRPWEEISMDFISGLPEVYDGQRFVNCILVIVDRFTKQALFFPVHSTINGSELARLVHNEVELRYGTPCGVVSDRGPIFTSQLWSELCYHTKIRRRLSTAFHPQTDGQTEAVNQILERYLRCFVNDEQSNWHTLLRSAEYCHNSSRNSSTGESPFFALFGYNPELRLDLNLEDEVHPGGVPGVHMRL